MAYCGLWIFSKIPTICGHSHPHSYIHDAIERLDFATIGGAFALTWETQSHSLPFAGVELAKSTIRTTATMNSKSSRTMRMSSNLLNFLNLRIAIWKEREQFQT